MALDFNFGKYAPYLWSALALTGLVIGWMIADTLLRARYWRIKVEKLQADKQARAGKP